MRLSKSSTTENKKMPGDRSPGTLIASGRFVQLSSSSPMKQALFSSGMKA
jgi:hypothetical protein